MEAKMIKPQIDEFWEDAKGNKYMTFYTGYTLCFVGALGNYHDFNDVVHGVDGWQRLYPVVDYE